MTHAGEVADFWFALIVQPIPLGSPRSNVAKAASHARHFRLPKKKISSITCGIGDIVSIRAVELDFAEATDVILCGLELRRSSAGSADNNPESWIILQPTLERILEEN